MLEICLPNLLVSYVYRVFQDTAHLDITNLADDDIRSLIQDRGLLDAFQSVRAICGRKAVGYTNDVAAVGLGGQKQMDTHNKRIIILGLMRFNTAPVNN